MRSITTKLLAPCLTEASNPGKGKHLRVTHAGTFKGLRRSSPPASSSHQPIFQSIGDDREGMALNP